MAMNGDGGEGGRLEKLLGRDAGARSPIADTLFQLCMRSAIVIASCYGAFVAYITMIYMETWLERLRLLPLLIVTLTVPVLGAVMIQKKYHMALQS